MRNARLVCVVSIAAAVVALCLAACGSGGSKASTGASATGSAEVANVGGTPITQAQVSHWMTSLAGNDYYTVSQHATIPSGIVADPPDYGRCLTSVEAAIRQSRGKISESKSELQKRCQQLNEAVKIQATSHLLTALRAIGIAQELGVTATSSEVQKHFAQATAREYPTQADYRHYLKGTAGSVSDGLLESKLELLGNRMLARLKSPEMQARYLNAEKAWTAKITCREGYVVEHCKEYAGGETYPNTPPPSVQMEQLAALITGFCSNLEACAKQAAKK